MEICETCKRLGELCGCSDVYCDGYEQIELTKEENMQDTMIRASNKALVTREQLFNVLFQKGVLAVYNLGMQHMYEYLEEEC